MITGIELTVLIVFIIIILITIMYISLSNTISGDKIDTFNKYLNTKNDEKSTIKAINEVLEKNDFKEIEVDDDEVSPVSLKTKEVELIKSTSIYNEIDSKNRNSTKNWLNKVLLNITKTRNKNKIAKLKIKSKLLSTVEKVILAILFRNNKKNKGL